MKILNRTQCLRENELDFLRCSGKYNGVWHFRYWLIYSGWKYEIEITKEEADYIRNALKENNLNAVYQMLITLLISSRKKYFCCRLEI